MDRVTTYVGAVPSARDVLNLGQKTMISIAKMGAAILGTNTIVNGFTCTPTTPASLNVLLTAGEIYQLENLEATAWSALPADTTDTILKQGILLQPATIGITPPGTGGYSQAYLIEVQYQDSDTATTVLNYYNSSNPASPYYGPPVGGTGSGAAQSTIRAGAVAYQAKAGTAAPTGTQVAPTADAGWTGLFVVTVANGATGISSGNINQVYNAPFIPATLPAIPADVQNNGWTYAIATGTANAITASVAPSPLSIAGGLEVHIQAAYANTGNVTLTLNGFGPYSILDGYGNQIPAGAIQPGMILELYYNGTNFQLTGPGSLPAPTAWVHVGNDTGTPGAIVSTVSPPIAAYTKGDLFIISIGTGNTNTGPATANFNGLGTVPIVSPISGSALTGGEISATVSYEAMFIYDGTSLRLMTLAIPTFLTAPKTFYVNASTGNDSNNGLTSGSPFLTLQKAVNTVALYNLNGFNITVNVANGTYAPVSLLNVAGSGSVNFVGNTGSPASCVISSSLGSCIFATAGGNSYTFSGFKFTCSADNPAVADPGAGVYVNGSGIEVTISSVEFGTCQGAHIFSTQGAIVFVTTSMRISGGLTSNAYAPGAFAASVGGGKVTFNPGSPPTLTVTTAVNIPYFILCQQLSLSYTPLGTITGGANVTGSQYSVTSNSVIVSQGTTYPGNSGGTTSTGGIFT